MGLQGLHPVGTLPGQIQIGAAEVAVGGQLAVDGTAQVQIPNDGGGTQIKGLFHRVLQGQVGDLPVPKVSTRMETGSATPMA